jgi:hypothetical protein
MDFIFVIDISWSMDSEKWSNWALSIISYIFSQTLMHLEKSIQNAIGDPDYKINMNFVLYWDDIWFSTLWNEKFQDLPSKVKFAKSFEEIQKLTWWTDDRTWWEKVANEIWWFLDKNYEYKKEVKEWKRKPVILQIADTDVSEYWVNKVNKMLKEKWLDEKSFSKKRLILWKYKDIDFSKFWKDVNANWKKIKKQEFVWNKKQIIKKIKDLFENFIFEYLW